MTNKSNNREHNLNFLVLRLSLYQVFKKVRDVIITEKKTKFKSTRVLGIFPGLAVATLDVILVSS